MDSSTQWNSLWAEWEKSEKTENKCSSQCFRSIERLFLSVFFLPSSFFCYLILFINSLFWVWKLSKFKKKRFVTSWLLPVFYKFMLCVCLFGFFFFLCPIYILCLFGLFYCLTFGCNRAAVRKLLFDNTIHETGQCFHCMDRINENEMNTNWININ